MLFRKTALVLALLFLISLNNSVPAGAGCSGVYFKTTEVEQLTGILRPVFVDMDGDGIKDMIGHTGLSVSIVFYKGSANGFDTPRVFSNLEPFYEASLGKDSFVDFNNDGKLDIVAHRATEPPYAVGVYLNNGNNRFIFSHTIDAPVPGALYTHFTIAVADLNNDGRPDIITQDNGFDRAVYYRLQTAKNTFGPSILIGARLTNFSIKDINNDGKIDFAYSTSSSPTEYEFQTQINQGNGTFALVGHALVPYDLYRGNNAILSDINNDGKTDAVTGIYANDNVTRIFFSVFQFDAAGAITATETELTGINPAVSYRNSPRAADFDYDGDLDLTFFSNVNNVVALRSGGLNFTFQKTASSGDAAPTIADFNGDNKPDILFANYSALLGNGAYSVSYKRNVCERVGQTKFVDLTGDGENDIGFWRASDGAWLFHPIPGEIHWGSGAHGDIPVPQDYDGDGISDFAVYRNSTGYWYIYLSGDGQTMIAQFGLPGDKPVPADYDGDTIADLAVFRPSEGNWYYRPSTIPQKLVGTHWGLDGDIPLPMDYDGDGAADIAIYRPTTGSWYILHTADNGYTATNFGGEDPGDRPMPADYDKDGKADLAIWRPSYFSSTINWRILTARNLYGLSVGGTGDQPFAASMINDLQASPHPAAFRPSNSSISIYQRSLINFGGNSGNRNISWILPLD